MKIGFRVRGDPHKKFRFQRYARFDSGYSTYVSLQRRWKIAKIFYVKVDGGSWGDSRLVVRVRW